MADKNIMDEGVQLHRVKGEFEIQKGAQQLGRVGIWLGSRHNAALYIAGGFVLLALIILMIFALFVPESRMDVVKVFAGVVIAGVGYIAGIGKSGGE